MAAATTTSSVDSQIEIFVQEVLVTKNEKIKMFFSLLFRLHECESCIQKLNSIFVSFFQNVSFLEEAFDCVIVHNENTENERKEHFFKQMSE